MFKNLYLLTCAFIIASGFTCLAQNLMSTDDLLKEGRNAISNQKDYKREIDLLRKAYNIDFNYTDVQVALGRAYQLNNQIDSARFFFAEVRLKEPGNTDVLNYLISLEYKAGNLETAILNIDSALTYQPGSEELMLKKASMLFEDKQYKRSQLALKELLKINPKNDKAHKLVNQLSLVTASDRISAYYDYSYFDRVFEPWQTLSLGYQKNTLIGSFIGRANYANRGNGLAGYQFELESYPLFSKSFYGNFGLAFGTGDPVFPDFTAKSSLFKSFGTYKLEGGFRYVKVPDEIFLIYSVGLSKYVSKFLLGFKIYISDFVGTSGEGFQLTSRYYYGDNVDNVFVLGLGTGVAPDLANRNLGIANIGNLSGKRIFSEYRRVLGSKNILSLLANVSYEEYTATKSANQYSIGVGYQRKF